MLRSAPLSWRGVLLIRVPHHRLYLFGVGPGFAERHFVPHRVRDTSVNKNGAPVRARRCRL
jgi:hypothetical protein